jgi:hypothetical protein
LSSSDRRLVEAVQRFLDGRSDVVDVEAGSAGGEDDELLALLTIHDLWLAPLDRLGGRVVFQHDPLIAAVKRELEGAFLERLRVRCPEPDLPTEEPAAAVRRIAAASAVPEIYRWLERDATWADLIRFVAMEGGPDAGFDDLVAMAQVGVRGDPKVCLAANYWDEMGRGRLDAVHTELHAGLVEAVGMHEIPRAELPTGALERMVLGGLLVTNRRFQPEALGAFGLLELQAGPRCRAVVRALERLDAPPGAFPFYAEHASADPRHGKDWLDHVIAPLSSSSLWAEGMVRGARWRAEVNRRFFHEALDAIAPTAPPEPPLVSAPLAG